MTQRILRPRYLQRQVAALGLALAIAGPAHAAFGDRDCSFGNAGTHTVAGAFGAMMSAAAEADGNILVRMGYVGTGALIYRIGANGTTSIQVGFVGGGDLPEPSTVLQGDGRVVASTGCGFSDCAGNVGPGGTPPGIVRFLASGGLDSSFGTGGYATLSGFTNAASGPIVQPDGRILVAGTFNGASAVVRFNADGSPDSTFGSGGVAPGGGHSIALQSDGFILVTDGSTLKRHRPDGRFLDPTFGSGGTVSLSGQFTRARQVRLQPGGKIIVVGGGASFTSLRIARYDSTGTLDTTAANGVGYRDVTYNGAALDAWYSPHVELEMMADGRPVVVGAPASGQTGALVRYGIDLADDSEVALDSWPSAALALPTGRVLVGRWTPGNEVRRLLGDMDAPTCMGTLFVHIDDPAVAEGNSGTTLLGFTVSLNRAHTSTVTVSYATADVTAFAGSDYTARSGTVSFAPGQTQRWVVVPVATNLTAQPNRSFFVNLTNATAGAMIAKAQGTGTINDDDPAPAAATVPMYRLYSDITKEHLYTTDSNEYAVLGTSGWVQEGTAWTLFGNGTHAGQYTIPLYRLYHGGIRQHHWTTDANEVMVLAAQGAWQYESIAGYLLPSAAAGSTPLYKLMYTTPPLHLWTTDANEKNVLSTQRGWVYEGIVGEVLP